MTKYYRFSILIAAILMVVSFHLHGQSILNPVQPEKIPKIDSTQLVVKAIPLSNINSSSTHSYTLFTRIVSARITASERQSFESTATMLVDQGNKFLADKDHIDFKELNFRELDRIQNELNVLLENIALLQQKTNLNLQQVQKNNEELNLNRQRWSLTLANSRSSGTPAAIRRRINSVINSSDSISALLENDMSFLLTQSDRVTGIQIRLNRFSNDLQDYSKISSEKLFRLDMPPIWGVFSESERVASSDRWQDFKTKITADTKNIIENSSKRIVLIFFILIILVGLVYWLKGTMKSLTFEGEKSVLSLFIREIFRKPVEVSLLIGLYLFWLLVPEIPPTFTTAIAIITIYALSRMAFSLLVKEYWQYIIGVAAAYLLYRFYGLFYDYLILGRLLLLLVQLIALYYTIHIVYKRSKFFGKNKVLKYFSAYAGGLFLAFLILALAGNIFGMISFSEYLTGGVVKSTFHILTVYIGFHILSAIFYIVLKSPLFNGSNILKTQSDFIFEKIYKLNIAFFAMVWVFTALGHFKIKSIFVDWASEMLFRENFIGEKTFTVMSIILFVFVIWLSIFVSRVVRHILHEEVFPRVKVEKGMPGTIIMLVRISLISLGFFLAAAAAGVELSSLAIILGAFSVGIGFGLQNIFNNLVSGLILAFERPIKEGDVIELNSLLGTVKKIGIRSSIIRMNSGAEVIVPNGELISKELTNWTLSDQYRRADIQTGVAYGTDPSVVINLLLQVARENKRVNDEPAPQAFFIDFGESSLNFRLLAWVNQDFRWEIESEIRVAINVKLKEAGIEVPFPQRDLHLKTMSEDVGKKLK